MPEFPDRYIPTKPNVRLKHIKFPKRASSLLERCLPTPATVRDVMNLTYREMLAVPGVGPLAIEELGEALSSAGVVQRLPEPPQKTPEETLGENESPDDAAFELWCCYETVYFTRLGTCLDPLPLYLQPNQRKRRWREMTRSGRNYWRKKLGFPTETNRGDHVMEMNIRINEEQIERLAKQGPDHEVSDWGKAYWVLRHKIKHFIENA